MTEKEFKKKLSKLFKEFKKLESKDDAKRLSGLVVMVDDDPEEPGLTVKSCVFGSPANLSAALSARHEPVEIVMQAHRVYSMMDEINEFVAKNAS
jgi:hypothetical protein